MPFKEKVGLMEKNVLTSRSSYAKKVPDTFPSLVSPNNPRTALGLFFHCSGFLRGIMTFMVEKSKYLPVAGRR
jgi:hypothetical protein